MTVDRQQKEQVDGVHAVHSSVREYTYVMYEVHHAFCRQMGLGRR